MPLEFTTQFVSGPTRENDENSRDGTLVKGWNPTYQMPVTYIYAYASATLAAGSVYLVDYDAATDTRWETATAATGSGYLAVATEATSSGSLAKLIIAGPVEDLDCTGTIVAGDHLEVLNSAIVANCDGTSGATVLTSRSFARALTAAASNMCDAILYGDRVDIAAS